MWTITLIHVIIFIMKMVMCFQLVMIWLAEQMTAPTHPLSQVETVLS